MATRRRRFAGHPKPKPAPPLRRGQGPEAPSPAPAEAGPAQDRQDGGTRSTGETIELAQNLKVIRKIADGGMGTVYLAEQLGVGGFSKTVALKVIRREWLRDKRALGLFVGEARLVADLVHANICQVYSLGRHRGQLFIVMEYLHGLSLARFLAAHKAAALLPPPDYSAFITSRVCRALAYAHTKKGREGTPLGVVHRDVTPGNVMLDFRGFVKLSDFGIALAATVGGLEGPGLVTGKLSYMSPEQARAEPVDYRSDIYSLGLCLYELLTGEKVYTARTVAELREQIKRRVRPPRELNDAVPEELSRLCVKALAPDPLDRFQSAKGFGDALEYFMYRDKWGPTNEKLATYLQKVFPDIERDRIV